MSVQLPATRYFLSEEKKMNMQQFMLAFKQAKRATSYNLINLLCDLF